MKGIKGLRASLPGAVALLLAVVGGLVLAGLVSAASGTIRIGSGEAATGEQVSVDLEALDVTEPGLSAWGISIVYDSDVVSVVACDNDPAGFCNPEYAEATVFSNGAILNGTEGDTILATITFECEAEGTSDLALAVDVLADFTVGDPQPIDASLENGRIRCGPGDPSATSQEPVGSGDTGTDDDSGGSRTLVWIVVALVAVGLAVAVGFGVLRLRGRRA